jgi:hypothetical protein
VSLKKTFRTLWSYFSSAPGLSRSNTTLVHGDRAQRAHTSGSIFIVAVTLALITITALGCATDLTRQGWRYNAQATCSEWRGTSDYDECYEYIFNKQQSDRRWGLFRRFMSGLATGLGNAGQTLAQIPPGGG